MHKTFLFEILYSNHSRRKAQKKTKKKLTLAAGQIFTNGETWVRSHLKDFDLVFLQCFVWLFSKQKLFSG